VLARPRPGQVLDLPRHALAYLFQLGLCLSMFDNAAQAWCLASGVWRLMSGVWCRPPAAAISSWMLCTLHFDHGTLHSGPWRRPRRRRTPCPSPDEPELEPDPPAPPPSRHSRAVTHHCGFASVACSAQPRSGWDAQGQPAPPPSAEREPRTDDQARPSDRR
jgi:hypothetical protein